MVNGTSLVGERDSVMGSATSRWQVIFFILGERFMRVNKLLARVHIDQIALLYLSVVNVDQCALIISLGALLVEIG